MAQHIVILEWSINKQINHLDSEEELKVMVNILLINYLKMEREINILDKLITMEPILLVNVSMD